MVEAILLEFYQRLDRSGFLVEDVLDIVDAIGAVGDGVFNGGGKGWQSEVLLESDEFLGVFSDIALVPGQFFEIVPDSVAHGHQDGDFFRHTVWLPVFQSFHAMRFEFDALVFEP